MVSVIYVQLIILIRILADGAMTLVYYCAVTIVLLTGRLKSKAIKNRKKKYTMLQ